MKTYSEEERYQIECVMEKVYEVLETTSNDVFFEVGRFGVVLNAYDGPVADSNRSLIFEPMHGRELTRADADRMIAELDVLGHFNKVFSDTKQDADITKGE